MDLGLDETYATPLEVVDGRLTGRTLFENEPRWKERRCEGLLRAAGREIVDALVAFGDSPSDISILERVGRPVVLNPQPAFEAEVRALGWPVLRDGDDVAAGVRALRHEPAWNASRALEVGA
ncbi:MAG: hypothetical protein K6V73_06525 [Firmicutes bacterium]|nr:hypothetical protein [Bacillota bacterium]